MSKFTEFADTFFFIARKKFAHVSLLQVHFNSFKKVKKLCVTDLDE